MERRQSVTCRSVQRGTKSDGLIGGLMPQLSMIQGSEGVHSLRIHSPIFLLSLTAIALYFCYLLVAPFLRAIVVGAVLAIIFYPAHALIRRRIRNANAAALGSTTLIILVLSLSSLLLSSAVVRGLRDMYQAVSNSTAARGGTNPYSYLLDRTLTYLGDYIPFTASTLRDTIATQFERSISALLGISLGAVGSITSFLVNGVIAFFVLFFFLRGGRSMMRRAVVIFPLPIVQTKRLITCVKDTLSAVVYGSLVMAALQGALTGIAFWILGLPSPVLWSVATGLCALLPVFGTALILAPASLMLIFGGYWVKALILIIWGLVVVHPIDNILRPYLIGDRARLSTLLVFFALLGGLKAFGGVGIFLGPLILAVTMALFRFLREEKRAGSWRAAEESHDL